jgi:hypothetical protein
MSFNIILYGYICSLIVTNIICYIFIRCQKDVFPREKIKNHIFAFLLCLIPLVIPVMVVTASACGLFCILSKKFNKWIKADPVDPKNISSSSVDTDLVKPLKIKKKKKDKPIKSRFDILDLRK